MSNEAVYLQDALEIALMTLDAIENNLRSYLTEDWAYGYRRMGPKMEPEYHARQALYSLKGLRSNLCALEGAVAALSAGGVGNPQ